jgi:uncharacterized protein
MKKRYLTSVIQEDVKEKMVFIAGPRQVGKTTLSQGIAKLFSNSLYLLWDKKEDRMKMMKSAWPAEASLIILDELHKYKKWKTYIKGEYDHYKNKHHFIVTGSARLDVYRKGGDSLQGRYHHYRLHPFSIAEMDSKQTPQNVEPFKELKFSQEFDDKKNTKALQKLLEFSGFPEPLLAENVRTHRRWQKQRMERFFREDIRDLGNIQDLSSMQLLIDLLPEKAANLLSLNSIREDLDVSHKALSRWVTILEKLYFCYLIRPFNHKFIRSIKKQPKMYLWDWTLLQDKGLRYENLIASHLLKYCHFLEDYHGYKAELFFLRDVDKREVDFLVTVDRKPWFAVEAKSGSQKPSPHLKYFKSHINIPYVYQVVCEDCEDVVVDGIRVMPASKFLLGLV